MRPGVAGVRPRDAGPCLARRPGADGAGGTYRYDLADLEAVAGGLGALAVDFAGAFRTGKQLEGIRGSATAPTELIGGYVEHDGTAASGVR